MKKLDMMRAIKERGFMAKDVADKLGITTVAMSLRTNANNPRLDTMAQIAEIIGCDITDLFYPDPAEEEEERKKALENAKDSKIPLEPVLRDLARRAYPSITQEEVEEWVEAIKNKKGIQKFDIRPGKLGLQNAMDRLRQFEEARKKHDGETLDTTLRGDLPEGIIERDVNFVQQLAGNETAYPVHSDGLVSENQQQMIQTSTFCPHSGKKVRVGIVLLKVEC